MVRRDSGFTLLEMVIVVAIIALLAGILVPVTINQVEEAQLARALGDVKALCNSLVIYKTDSGVWPTTKKMLYSDGALATSEAANWEAAGDSEHIERCLRDNLPATVGWNGPYMSGFAADPWGNRYVVEINGVTATGSPYGWIISAGPDGQFQTAKTDTTLKGDDIGLLLK